MSFNPAQARRNITIEFVDKDYSRYAVFPVVASFLLDEMGLNTAFNRVLKMESERYSFSASDYLLTLFSSIFLGIPRIYHIDDVLAPEVKLARMLGLPRFPTGRALYLLLSGMDYWDWQRLSKVRFKIIKQHRNLLSHKRWLVADIDQTNKLTEGRKIEKATPCFDRKRKGKLGLRLSSSQVEGLIFSQKLEPGNTACITSFNFLFRATAKQLAKLSSPLKLKRIKDKRLILRIDGGYFSTDTLRFLDGETGSRKLDFVVRAKANLKLISAAKNKAKPGDWQWLNQDTRILRLSNQAVLPNHDTGYTVLVIKGAQTRIKSKNKRVYQTKKSIEYVLVTTLKSWKTERIITFYKQRQQIENIFRDYNQSFKASKLPSHSFWGNAFYFEMVSLVHNITFFLSKHCSQKPIKAQLWQPFAASSSTSPVS